MTRTDQPLDPARRHHSDGFFEVCKAHALYYQRWDACDGAPILIVHGGGEHSGRYAQTIVRLVREGYTVHTFDLPGHGRSPGKRGHIPHFDQYVQSVQQFLVQVIERDHFQKPILLGHSLGGLIATFFAIQHPERIRCLVLSSPLWGLSVAVPWWKRLIAHLLSPIWPSLTMERPRLGKDALSHDPQVGIDYLADPWVHFRASVRLYTELQNRFRELPRVLLQLRVPLLVLQAGDDKIASAEAVKNLFPLVASDSKRLIVYEGFYHEVLNEVEKERVFQDLILWLRQKMG